LTPADRPFAVEIVATPKQGRVVLADTYGQPTSFYISKNLNSNGETSGSVL
jgi:hypothetical protein